NGKVYRSAAFSPGYDLGTPGPLGLIPVEFAVAPPGFIGENSGDYDYSMMRMRFNDQNGYTLQQYTGAHGWKLDVRGDDILTNVFGYPTGGTIPDCPRDGEHLCVF